MGTRHLQTVIDKDGEIKIQQYGQWDGYPEGQGKSILNYLKTGDLAKYQENLSKIHQITPEEIEIVNTDDNWFINYPYLSRDCGSNIHKMIEDGTVQFVRFEDEGRKWCEGFYTIDFKENKFISEYHGVTFIYNLNELPIEEEYLNAFNTNNNVE